MLLDEGIRVELKVMFFPTSMMNFKIYFKCFKVFCSPAGNAEIRILPLISSMCRSLWHINGDVSFSGTLVTLGRTASTNFDPFTISSSLQ